MIMNQPIVIDNGTGLLKAGYAGGTKPEFVFPSFVGRPKHTRAMATSEITQSDTFVGEDAYKYRSILKLEYAMEHGTVDNWDDMEKIWTHLYTSQLRVATEEHPVLLTEAPLNPLQNREKAAEIFFESFNVPALFFSMQAVLSLYASGRTTGLVLDCGDGVTHCVPVYEGFSMQHAITRLDIAGRDVTDQLQVLLRKAGHTFHTSAEREVVRAIKEKACFVTPKPIKAEDLRTYHDSQKFAYKLPDGNVVNLSNEYRCWAPELLFRPSIIGSEYMGVHEAIDTSIRKSDLDMRRSLYQSILLSGGTTLLYGFGDRLLSELSKLSPKDGNVKIKISAPPERQYTTWIGGSILASLATFKKMWTTKREYEEQGASIIHRKTF